MTEHKNGSEGLRFGGAHLTQESITPERARFLLLTNANNRRIRPRLVTQYADDMREGRWRFTADPLRFDTTGALIDGQHRLHAIIEAGVTVEMTIVWGLDVEAKVAIDTGSRRTLRDVFHMKGIPSDISSTVRWCWRYENNALETNRGYEISNTMLLEWYEAHSESERKAIWTSTLVARRLSKRLRIDLPSFAGVHYFCSQVDSNAADEFMGLLAEPVNVPEGSPILALRTWIERQAIRRDRPSAMVYTAVLIKAVNHYRVGNRVRGITWRGATELFPLIEWEAEVGDDGIEVEMPTMRNGQAALPLGAGVR